MAGEWRTSTWGEEISLEYGKALRGHGTGQGRYRVFGSNGPIGWADEWLAKGPGVILGRKGAYRGVEFSREPFFVIDTAYYVVPKTELDMRWLYYAIKHYKLGEIDDGSPIPSTTRAAVYLLNLDVPAPDEQRAIAHILGTFDDKIELNRRMNETLEAMARSTFTAWFLKEVESLAGTPKGWQQTKWGEIITLEYGESLSSYSTDEGKYPVYGTNGRIGTTSQPLCSHEGIIIGRKGAYRGVHFCSAPFFVIDTAFFVEPKVPIDMRWAYYEMLRLDINSMDSGSAIPSTSRDDFYNLPVVLPPYTLQQKFSQLLKPLWDRQEHNDRECASLSALRDALLPKLISGDLRVGQAGNIATEMGR